MKSLDYDKILIENEKQLTESERQRDFQLKINLDQHVENDKQHEFEFKLKSKVYPESAFNFENSIKVVNKFHKKDIEWFFKTF